MVGVVGLLVFLLGFEYGFVTSLSLTSEAMPEARGATLAIGNAVGTLARGGGTILSGVLYGAFGIGGTAALSACAARGVADVLPAQPSVGYGFRPRKLTIAALDRVGMRVRTEVAGALDLDDPRSRAASTAAPRPPADGAAGRARRTIASTGCVTCAPSHGGRGRRSASSPSIVGPSARRAALVDGGSRSHLSSPTSRRMNASPAVGASSPVAERGATRGLARPPVAPTTAGVS